MTGSRPRWTRTVIARYWGPGASTPPIPQQDLYSGGWEPVRKRKTKQDVRKEREEWGIIAKKAKAIIQRVAAQQVERVEEPDNTEALIAAFNRAELAFKDEFRVLYLREIERQLAKMREEEEILLLLH